MDRTREQIGQYICAGLKLLRYFKSEFRQCLIDHQGIIIDTEVP